MPLVDNTLISEYARRTTESTKLFEGRRWVFDSLAGWLALTGEGGGGQFYLLTGEPGSGKSAIAGRLYQFSRGDAPTPEGLSQLGPGFLSAVHFCSARDSSLVDPYTFSRSLAHQLAARYDEYAKALTNVGEKTIHSTAEVDIGNVEAGASVEITAFNINNVVLSGLTPREAFNRTVLAPLRGIYATGFDKVITILIDALDESLSRESGPSILDLISHLGGIPNKVRFILTSRDDERVVNELLDATRLSISASENDDDNQTDIAEYVARRLEHDEHLAAGTKQAESGRLKELADKLKEQAGGNFLYITFLLDAVAQGRRSLDALDDLPAGLDKLYYDSLRRVVKLGNKSWGTDYAPLMGVLSVAREPLSYEQLLSFLGTPESALDESLRDLQQFLEPLTQLGDDEAGTGVQKYRLYHQSVVDFLFRPMINEAGKQLNNTYHLRHVEWHRRIADSYLQDDPPDWDSFDDYGLRHIATHLSEVARSAATTPQQRAERHRQAQRLARIVADDGFQEAHSKRVKDLAALQRDIWQALRCAVDDEHKDAPLLVVEMALALVAFRRERLRPGPLFELARRGEVEEAERQLELFSVESEWQLAARLIIAWLAYPANPEGAHKLRDRANQTHSSDPNLSMLRTRLDAALAGVPPPMFPLPPPPSEELISAMVKGFGGLETHAEMLESDWQTYHGIGAPNYSGTADAGDPLFYHNVKMTQEIGYIAERDGPLLVSFAVAHPLEGTGFLNDYLSVHTNYNYAHYRNRSLWALLNAVLRHPQQSWVEQMLPALASTALSGSVLEFQESLPLTILGLRARAGDTDSLRLLEETAATAANEAQQLVSARGNGDSWGSRKRRLAALAEVFTALLDRPDTARQMLELALCLPYGFAGFQSPTCLTLAEAIRVCAAEDVRPVEQVLQDSRQAAHNIQDATYCVRLTARYNAMSQRWWNPSLPAFDVERVVERFSQSPSGLEFSALHIVGEKYEHRSKSSERLPLPRRVREAKTLADLTRAYQRPLVEFQRLNAGRGWSDEEPLPPGTEVNVPDPGFATLLAARFAAEVLASRLAVARRVRLLQSLVPLAAANTTAVDCVLSRLLLGALPNDAAAFDKIAEAARSVQEAAATLVVKVNESIFIN